MTLQDVKRRLKVMKARGYNANTIRDMEWLVAEVDRLRAAVAAGEERETRLSEAVTVSLLKEIQTSGFSFPDET